MGWTRAIARLLLALVLFAQLGTSVALADTPEPKTPTPSPPTPSPVAPAPAPSPTASASASPSATPAPTAAGAAQYSPDELAQAQAVIQATSLLARLEAEQQLATAQRAFIDQRISQLTKQREDVLARIATLQAQAVDRQQKLDRIVQDEYRASQRTPLEVLLSTGSILSAIVQTNALGALADAEAAALREVQRTQAELQAQKDELATHETELTNLAESLSAKDAALARLHSQATLLSRGGSSAEVAVLQDLVDEQLQASAKVDQLVAQAAAAAGAPPLQQDAAWVWPAKGTVSQAFGPSALDLEPPLTYHGIAYPHFHAGLDIAAPLGSPVFAAQAGRVAFVGHLPDGAEVVLVAHDGGLFSLYAHLDDVHVPPPVKAGDVVKAGDLIGVVGLTGITTGAHLHFVIRRGDEPLDPRSLLPAP